MVVITTALGYLAAAAHLLVILFLVLLQYLAGNLRLFDWLIKLVCRAIPMGFGVSVHVTGRHRVPRDGACIFMANHVNIFDPLILFGYIPTFVRGVELDDHFTWPVWGAITRRIGNIPISHKSTERALQSLKKAAIVVHGGVSLAIMPEGHRTRDGKMGAFMRGPFRMARAVHADIVPMAMIRAYERKSVNSLVVHPGAMELAFGPPIPAELAAGQTERELRATVRQAIEHLLDQGV